MSLEDWKQAYRQLDPATRREFARWVVEEEMAAPGVGVGSVAPLRPPAGRKLPVKGFLVLGLGGVLALGGWKIWSWQQVREAERKRMTAAEREAEEARKPRSPKNLEFLWGQVGREVTITGVPERAEVGYLFFSRDKGKALRLNLLSGGVVLMQSAELEDLVQKKTEVTVTGLVEKAEDGVLEIKVGSLGQLRRRGP